MSGRHKPAGPALSRAVSHFALVAEKKAAPKGSAGPGWGGKGKKKRADAKPDLGPQPGGTIDGAAVDDVPDAADPSEATPDKGSGADARPFDQTQRAADDGAGDDTGDDTAFATLPDPESTQDATRLADASRPQDPQTPEPDTSNVDPATADPDVPQWAGDLDDTGDVSDPAGAYANFSGPNGEQAWLDKAPDGTLTGWIRDTDGRTYRYSDADTWAIDVDDAAMTRSESAPAPADTGTLQAGAQGKALRRVVRRIPAPPRPRASVVRIGGRDWQVTPTG